MTPALTLTLSIRQPDGSWTSRTASGTRDEIDALVQALALACLPEWQVEVGERCEGCGGRGVCAWNSRGEAVAIPEMMPWHTLKACPRCHGTGQVASVRARGGRGLEVVV